MNISVFLTVLLLSIASGPAADDGASAEDAAAYTAVLEARTADIMKPLALTDTNQAARVHSIILNHYRALNAWHRLNDQKLKSARGDSNALAAIHASLKSLHDAFLSSLGEFLTPAQLDQVKDKMTYGKVQFTLAGYLAQYPGLTDTNKMEILDLLKQAREEAMDGGSAAEKTAIFQRYKGRINNYLSRQGIHPARQKPAAGGAMTNAATEKQ